MAKPKQKKLPKVAQEPRPRKQPSALEPTVHSDSLAWRFSACDRDGDWAWTNLSNPGKYKEVMEKLHEFETKNWSEITRKGSHLVAINKIVRKAKTRLRDIKQDDVDVLMSFRLTGTNRVWCIMDRNIMRVLWWDYHTVYPSRKKHT